MFDLSTLTATQILVLKAVAEFDCVGIICNDCPFNTGGNGCGIIKVQNALYDGRRERDKD